MIRGLAQVLQMAGIDHIYGVDDDALKPIAEATRAAGGISWIELENEEAAACAAADDAEITGERAVCAGGYGIGACRPASGVAPRRGRDCFHAVATQSATTTIWVTEALRVTAQRAPPSPL